MSKVIGIDVSKATFDAAFMADGQLVATHAFTNDEKGFNALSSSIDSAGHVIMEASGTYHVRLAYFLYARGFTVSVVNPLVIRRFSQMQLSRTKTDRKDAALIASYGMAHTPAPWQPEEAHITQLKQLNQAIELLNRQCTAVSNQLEALAQCEVVDPLVIEQLEQEKGQQTTRIQLLEKRMCLLVNSHYKETYDALLTIPGIGPKTAVMLIAITGNFTKFEHYKQLLAYVGLSPRIYESGTSVKGRARICKVGMGNVRKLLYLCSWSAKRHNVFCAAMYDRLKAKGKPERLIKVAIANKLLRQAFAVGKNLAPFDEKYIAKLAN